MAIVKITADIDFQVKARSGRAVFSKGLFAAGPGDTVRWVLRGANGRSRPRLGGFKARVKFLFFPPSARRTRAPLLDGGSRKDRNTFAAVGNVITATGRAGAHAGRYGYLIELARGRERVELDCVWRRSQGGLLDLVMAGGRKPPEPPVELT